MCWTRFTKVGHVLVTREQSSRWVLGWMEWGAWGGREGGWAQSREIGDEGGEGDGGRKGGWGNGGWAWGGGRGMGLGRRWENGMGGGWGNGVRGWPWGRGWAHR